MENSRVNPILELDLPVPVEGQPLELAVKINQGKVEKFIEKPAGDNSYINGGFFVIKPKAIKDYIENEKTIWEKEPLENLVKDNELHAYNHQDFWQPMDTLRDKRLLDEYWENNSAPWRIW